MIGSARHLGKSLYEFFDIYPVGTIKENIDENIAKAQSDIYRNIYKNSYDSRNAGNLAETFRNSVTGYSADVYRDMIAYASMARQCHEYIHEKEGQSTPSEAYFLKRVKASVERGFNQNVKLDRFLEEFDGAVMGVWQKMGELKKSGIDYVGELVAHEENSVFKGHEPQMTRFIMKHMLREQGLSFQHWKPQKNRPAAVGGPKGG